MKISVVIEAGYKNQSLKPNMLSSLCEIGGTPLILKQIKTIQNQFELTDIIISSGYLDSKLPTKNLYKTVYNKNYDITNTAYNVGLGLKKAKYRRALVVSGNTLFNKNTLDINYGKNPIVYTTNDYDDNIGCSYSDDTLSNMFFGLPNRWSGLLYISGESLDKFIYYCLLDKRRFLFEAINDLSNDFTINVVQPKKSKVVLINSNKDIELAKRLK